MSQRPATYFAVTFAISWTAALLVAAPALLRHQGIPKMTGLMMFPAMLAGPAFAGVFLTAVSGGRPALNHLFLRMRRFRFPGRWYATLLIPPALVLSVLLALKMLLGPVFAPNHFFIGVSFGIAAGFFEEIGWMGCAFPRLCSRHSPLASAVLLGLLWGLWHLPVIDSLGAASPHGSSWAAFMLAFVAAMTALRVLIAWAYTNTQSIALAQLLHAASTGSLVAFSAPRVTPAQEALWYALYACALWLLAALIAGQAGPRLRRRTA